MELPRKRLEALAARKPEIEKLLNDPKVTADSRQYQKLAKEHSEVSRLANKYEEYKKVTEELESVSVMLKQAGADKDLLQLAREETSALKERQQKIQSEIEEGLAGSAPGGDKNAIVEIRAGTGGDEASLFAGDLYRMYSKFAARCGLKIDVMNSHPAQLGGFKEIIFAVEGEGAFRNFKYESGVHRVQRVPSTEASGRIHTSTVTVAVLPEAEEVELEINPKDLKIDVYRSSGPGGQSVNTTDSAVRITHLPTGVIVTCQDERSQLKNKLKAMRVLRARLLDKMKTDQLAAISQSRKSQIGTGDRSEKIRTYNFPDRRITDHRIGLTVYKLEAVMEGEIDEFISALHSAERAERLKDISSDAD
jgi:peptide chain release factor 1